MLRSNAFARDAVQTLWLVLADSGITLAWVFGVLSCSIDEDSLQIVDELFAVFPADFFVVPTPDPGAADAADITCLINSMAPVSFGIDAAIEKDIVT